VEGEQEPFPHVLEQVKGPVVLVLEGEVRRMIAGLCRGHRATLLCHTPYLSSRP